MTENEKNAIAWIKITEHEAEAKINYARKSGYKAVSLLYIERKERAEAIIKGFEELEQYRKIGSTEECRAAVEKQKAKPPGDIWGDGNDRDGNMIYDMYACPGCGKSYEIEYDHFKYCPECGQAIDRTNLI